MNIRECPKCGARVERVSGCNLMTCRCGQYFCWLCGGGTGFAHTWDKIDGHECGRYSSNNLNELGFDKEGKELPEEIVRRFEFYSLRHDAHTSSSKLEKKLIENVKSKIRTLMGKESDMYMHWLSHSIEKLFESRKILIWSYIFCFCLLEQEFRTGRTRKEVELVKTLFEHHQQQMESALERLSKELEAEYSTVDHIKRLIVMAIEVDKRCAGLYDVINREIFPNNFHKVKSYTRTTDGTQTLLVTPNPNLLQQIQVEIEMEKQKEILGTNEDILKHVLLKSQQEFGEVSDSTTSNTTKSKKPKEKKEKK